ncbi:ANTAR domain-containing protein [Streptomyces sp. NPDC005953]|uniref:ANTAR domain-containing protein n=1 Tax=Streptomyces sp. NPDC005953 TaxID=3156719 RepID=UPI0033C2947A
MRSPSVLPEGGWSRCAEASAADGPAVAPRPVVPAQFAVEHSREQTTASRREVPPASTRSTAGGGPDPSALGVDELRNEIAGLRKALASHPVIDMARGVIMATTSCTPEDAWQILVQVSQHSNTKLREVARHIVESAYGPPPPPQVRGALREVYSVRARQGQ